MRVATLLAAMRRGWVWPMSPPRRVRSLRTPRPASRQNLGSWVVLPDPVSPETMTTRWLRMASTMRARCSVTGKASMTDRMAAGTRESGMDGGLGVFTAGL